MSIRTTKMDTVRSERLSAAIDRAVAGAEADLVDLLHRNSGLPGPQANLDLARVVGTALASHGAKADRVVASLVRSDDEYLRVVAAMAFGAQSVPSANAKGRDRARVDAALADLQTLAEDSRHGVRAGIIAALRIRLVALGEPAVVDLASWTDGYLQAHVALEALADRTWLTSLHTSESLIARLDEAFVLADESPRAAERSQGMRTLRQGMPAQIVAFANRFPEALAWLEAKTASKRPETREVVEGALQGIRRGVVSDTEATRLRGLLEASGKPRRDADRVVHGTRKRSRGRS